MAIICTSEDNFDYPFLDLKKQNLWLYTLLYNLIRANFVLTLD